MPTISNHDLARRLEEALADLRGVLDDLIETTDTSVSRPSPAPADSDFKDRLRASWSAFNAAGDGPWFELTDAGRAALDTASAENDVPTRPSSLERLLERQVRRADKPMSERAQRELARFMQSAERTYGTPTAQDDGAPQE